MWSYYVLARTEQASRDKTSGLSRIRDSSFRWCCFRGSTARDMLKVALVSVWPRSISQKETDEMIRSSKDFERTVIV